MGDKGSINDESGKSDDTEEMLKDVVDGPKADIIADVRGHPHGAPSMAELCYMNPDKHSKEIRQHLDELIDYGVIEQFPALTIDVDYIPQAFTTGCPTKLGSYSTPRIYFRRPRGDGNTLQCRNRL